MGFRATQVHMTHTHALMHTHVAHICTHIFTYISMYRRCVLAVLDHFYRAAIFGESERPLAALATGTPRGTHTDTYDPRT